MKLKINRSLIYLLLFVFVIGCKDSDVTEPNNNQTEEITIAALLSLTGNWSTLGITSKAALEAAVEEMNQESIDEGKKIKFVLKIIDTKLDPDIAYAKTVELINEGVKVIIGPQSSAELSRIRPLVNENDIMVISMSSTAGALAVNGDHIFRFCPDDKPEGLAISELMWERGIREVVAVYRDDDGNIGLKRSMTNSFTNLGGIVIDSIKYSNDDNITAGLISSIITAVEKGTNQNEVGIYLAGFDEVTNIFIQSASSEILKSKIWFGSNGSASSSALISNVDASAFANSVEFCSPLFALSTENETLWKPLFNSIKLSTQLTPDAYTFAAYDAFMVAAKSYLSVSGNINYGDLSAAFTQIAQSYNGLTGLTELNEAGDRKYGNFTLLGICGVNSNYEWSSVGSYNAATNALIYTGCN